MKGRGGGGGGAEVQILSGMMFEIKSTQKVLYRMFGKLFRRGFGSKNCQLLLSFPLVPSSCRKSYFELIYCTEMIVTDINLRI